MLAIGRLIGAWMDIADKISLGPGQLQELCGRPGTFPWQCRIAMLNLVAMLQLHPFLIEF